MAGIVRFQVVLGLLTGMYVSLLPAALAQQPAESQVMPLKHLSIVTMDKRVEAVRGDRSKPGEPFVIRIRAEAGYIVMPHRHPIDENIVVVEGSWALGMGEHFKQELLEPMEVGTFGFAPKGMSHFALSKTATTLQVHGIGPFVTRWVVPVYELTDHGVLLKTGAEDPGSAATNTPPACFVLQLGTRVHGKNGSGVVIGAQCTPGELTQYRIETQGGEHFWAQRDALQVL